MGDTEKDSRNKFGAPAVEVADACAEASRNAVQGVLDKLWERHVAEINRLGIPSPGALMGGAYKYTAGDDGVTVEWLSGEMLRKSPEDNA